MVSDGGERRYGETRARERWSLRRRTSVCAGERELVVTAENVGLRGREFARARERWSLRRRTSFRREELRTLEVFRGLELRRSYGGMVVETEGGVREECWSW